jgi:hypothetical protein
MARIKTSNTQAVYAGRVIYDDASPLQALSDQWRISRNYSTEPVAIIDRESPEIRAYGNANGSFPLTVSIAYDSEEEAFSAALDWVAFADANQTGELRFTVGETTQAWKAGLESFEVSPSFNPRYGVRLALTFSFLVGEKIG